MFGKLLKYELRSCMKIFPLIWGGILALSVINAFTLNMGDSTTDSFASFLTIVLPLMLLVGLCTAALVVSLVYVIRRFYTGLLGDEGYLMFTLPVTSAQLIGAKALTALIVEVVSGLAALLGVCVILLVQVPTESAGFFRDAWAELTRIVQAHPQSVLAGIELILLVLLSMCEANLQIYTSIALGHLAPKHRAAWAAVAFFGIVVVLSVLNSMLVRLGVQAGGMNGFLMFTSQTESESSVTVSLAILLGRSLILNAAYFFGTNAILTKKLNLE